MVQITQADLLFLFEQVTFDNANLTGLDDHRGLRNVSGQGNNLVPGQGAFGSADQDFIRVAPGSQPDDYNNYDATSPPPGPGLPSSGLVVIDPTPRMISNVIADQGSMVIENAPALSDERPFNGWMTMFGQFFDHGLDFVGKGEQGFIMVPLDPSDPLYNPAPGAPNFMIVARANLSNLSEAGADNIFGTTDDVGYSDSGTPGDTSDDIFAMPRHVNHTSPFIDQNQTYGSSVSIRAALMEYEVVGGVARATGRLLDGVDGGLATWADIKANAAKIGLVLTDQDVTNAPLLRTNADGSVFRDANGHIEVLTDGSGNPLRSGHAFLLDINPAADPSAPGYDADLLNAHFVVGDGRANENYGLTAVHAVFHAEHNHMVGQIQAMLAQPGQTIQMTGEQIFEAAKLVTEMEYQHIVFDEFARRISPNIEAFHGNSYDAAINAAISGEFAHAVYRLGHSMLRETVEAIDPASGAVTSNSLIDAFLNPAGFAAVGGAGALALGLSMQVGSEIDEFVTDALRNNLLGLPLDLAAINITRGRDTGIPTLNELRQQLFAVEGNAALTPYVSWADFGSHLKNQGSLVNFIAAYAFGELALTDVAAARAQAQVAMSNTAFMNNSLSSGDALFEASRAFWDVDLWIGGLAEEKVAGGLLGSTFDAVFANQMLRLQNGDRFYYQARLSETNILHEIEGENFADMILRNTDVTHIHTDTFSAAQSRVSLTVGPDVSGVGRATFALSEVIAGLTGNDTIDGGAGSDSLYGDEGDDTLAGGTGNDFLTGGAGNDILTDSDGNDLLRGGDGNDTISAGAGEDLAHGGAGDDQISGGAGDDEIFTGVGNDTAHGDGGRDHLKGGEGNDTLYGDADDDRLFGEQGDDILFGGAGMDRFDGGEGNDIVNGGAGGGAAEALREVIDGDKGFDFASYAGAAAPVTADLVDFLTANTGDAQFDTYILIEGLIGSDHNDTLRGDGLDNEIRGEIGNDTLAGRGGNDRLVGGAGTDTAVYTGNRAAYTINLVGAITVTHNNNGADGSDTLTGVERLQFADQTITIGNAPAAGQPTLSDTTPTEGQLLTASIAGISDPNGMTGAVPIYQWQSLIGMTWSNIAGATAAAFAPGQLQVNQPLRVVVSFVDDSGNPEQVASAASAVVGDSYIGTAAANTFDGTAGQDNAQGRGGNDTLNGNTGNDTLNGEGGNDTLNGGAGDDTLLGGAGNDTLDGGAGSDSMAGGAGGDTYFVESSGDTVTEDAGGGTDTVQSSITYLLGANVENLVLTGTAAIDGTGNAVANALTGNAAANVLNGGGGNDTISGGGGADILNGEAGNDILLGGAGLDTIDGGAGNDRVTGGSGNDIMVALSGNDTFIFDAVGFGSDRVTGFDSNAAGGQDLLDISGLGVTAATFGTVGIVQNGIDTLISIGLDRITLADVSAATVTQSDFLLAL